MKKLVVDMDSTIVNSLESIIKVYNELNDENIDWRNVKTWDFSCSFKDANLKMILWLFEHPLFFENLEFYPGALESLETLHFEGYTIDVYSAGTPLNKDKKKVWLKEVNDAFKEKYNCSCDLLNWLECSSISHGKSCQDLSDAIFIDDRADNLESSNAKEKILFKFEDKNYVWNESWDGKVANSWNEEMLELIREAGRADEMQNLVFSVHSQIGQSELLELFKSFD